MAAIPLLEETSGGTAGAMVSGLAGLTRDADPAHIEILANNRPERKLAIYPASAGFDLVEELDFLCTRTIEPNVFFNPRFLAPAMPRLEDREVRLAVIRDGDEYRNRLRLLVPFSVERPMVPLGVPVMRTWSSPFGPLGTPLVDRDDPVGVVEDFFSMLSRPHLKLPKVFILPDIRLDGQVASLLATVAETRGLMLVTTSQTQRPALESEADGDAYLKTSLRAHHYREFRRLKRRLGDLGKLEHVVARVPDEIRHAIESFLTLEAAGWKGRERTAMAIDRYRAAFAREAVHRLAEQDMCRIHSLTLDGRTIACLIVFVEAGVAYTWKTAYDEALGRLFARHVADARGDQAASRRSQHHDDRFLRHARPSGDEPAMDRAQADGHAGDRPDAGRRPPHPPGRLATAPLPRNPQHGPPAAPPDEEFAGTAVGAELGGN